MKIRNIRIGNFRLLKDFNMDLREELSLVIGKNNTGKTSFLTLLQKFLNTSSNYFTFEDFNIDFKNKIYEDLQIKKKVDEYVEHKIFLKICIEYFEDDNLRNIADFFLDLEPKNNFFVLNFEYVLNHKKYEELFNDYQKYKDEVYEDIFHYLRKNHKKYFRIKKYVIDYENEDIKIEIDEKNIIKIINFQSIGAKRNVANDENGKKSNSALSRLSHRYFELINNPNDIKVIELQKELLKTDKELNNNYKKLFKPVIENVKKFGYGEETKLEIQSRLEELNILRENTTVLYNNNGQLLPEEYNGLGYMNLFELIFNIHIMLDEFKRKYNNNDERPANINLLFIEEPEAHTHPQMQYIFINNIKEMLELEAKEYGINLQTIVSTHSSHITSQSDFNDIVYFHRTNNNDVKAKNLSNFKDKYLKLDNDNENQDTIRKKEFQFLKRYLTLNRAELLFADKVVFIEGDTERILLPTMMKKIDLAYDLKEERKTSYIPLLSQNISIIEVGSYSHVFDEFLEFLNKKTLIITDIDAVRDNREASCVFNGLKTSNASIKHFLGRDNLKDLKEISSKDRILEKENGKWVCNNDGQLYIAYQGEENDYHARSFEDAFISINLDFIKMNIDGFTSLKNKKKITNEELCFYRIANECIANKTKFATDIIYFSSANYENWEIPQYIKEGLEWLAK